MWGHPKGWPLLFVAGELEPMAALVSHGPACCKAARHREIRFSAERAASGALSPDSEGQALVRCTKVPREVLRILPGRISGSGLSRLRARLQMECAPALGGGAQPECLSRTPGRPALSGHRVSRDFDRIAHQSVV